MPPFARAFALTRGYTRRLKGGTIRDMFTSDERRTLRGLRAMETQLTALVLHVTDFNAAPPPEVDRALLRYGIAALDCRRQSVALRRSLRRHAATLGNKSSTLQPK